MSLMPRSRLICDSTKSPRVAVATIVKPSSRPIQTGLLASRVADNVTAVIPKISEPASPSHDLFGLIDGTIGCLPNSTPTK